MFAVIDARSPINAVKNLKQLADDVFSFSSEDITYNSISGHPDIFLFQSDDTIIIAPNTPRELICFLEKYNIEFMKGKTPVGKELSSSVQYNCVVNDRFFFHKKNMSDQLISENVKTKTFINLPQAYTRCSMISLDINNYITSDLGIVKSLRKYNLKVFYFSPEEIRITDHKHGFFGGTCGIYENKIFFNGNILKHKKGKELSNFIKNLNYEIISLHDDYLYDGGGIFFLESNF